MRVISSSIFYGCISFIIVIIVHASATLSQTTSTLRLVEQETTGEHRSSSLCTTVTLTTDLVGTGCNYQDEKNNNCVEKFPNKGTAAADEWRCGKPFCPLFVPCLQQLINKTSELYALQSATGGLNFTAGTKNILTTFYRCLGDVFHRNRNSASSTYNISRLGVSGDNGTYRLYITSIITGFGGGQFLLQISLTSTDSEAQDFNCSYYKYYQVESIKGNSFQAKFKDLCLLAVQPGKVYNLNVTNTQSHLSRVFRIFAPSRLHVDLADDSSGDWNSLIGVSIHSHTIEIYTQPAPAASGHFYVLWVTYSKGDGVQLQEHHTRLLNPSVTKWTFGSVGDLFYTIEIKRCQGSAEGVNLNTLSGCKSVQQHQLISSEIDTQRQADSMNSNSMGSSSTDKDVQVIRETESGILQKQDLYILLGTIFGVVVLVLIIVAVLLFYFRRRHNSQYGVGIRFSPSNEYSDDILLDEVSKGAPPSVLLLYSYDCQQHLACVQALALLLQNGLGCTVMADFWATQEIAERGIFAWLQQKMATVNYIIVVCSTGARFKSVSNRRLKLERVADDAYVIAIRQLQLHSGDVKGEKLAVYFDYSSESDIPVLFEKWQRYKLPQDIDQFVPSSMHDCPKDGRGSQKDKLQREKVCVEELARKVEETKTYMNENPDWFHVNLQPEISKPSIAEHTTLTRNESGQLPLVTVEHNGTARRCVVDEKVDVDETLKSGSRSNAVTPVATLKRQTHVAMDTERTSINGSYSSSLEDLEQDIDFILNPSAPRRVAFPVTSHYKLLPSRLYTSPPVLINILPDLPTSTLPPRSPASSLADTTFQLDQV